MDKEIIHDVNIEDTNIIPIPEESRRILNKKLIYEDPLKPNKKIKNGKIILYVLLFITIIVAITVVIYKLVLMKWMI